MSIPRPTFADTETVDATRPSSPSARYEGAPLPENEDERIELLRSLRVLDSLQEDSFDEITKMLTQVLNVPIALVSLVDSCRQWFKSVVGLPVKETSREVSFCAHLLLPEEPEVLVVPDTHLDERFCQNPLVLGSPGIRFYCGAPIIVSGFRLGSLCIIDTRPRPDMVDQGVALLLANFADIVAGLIVKGQEPHTVYDMIDQPSFLVDLATLGWPILYSNEAAKTHVGNADRVLDFITIDTMPDDAMSREACVLAGVYRQESLCMCYLHPTDQQVLGKDRDSRIYVPDDVGEDEESQHVYSFVVVKFDSKGSAATSRLGATFPLSSKVHVLRSADELVALASTKPCVVLFTSRFCGACTRFEEYYKMTAKVMGKPDVQFCVVNVDDAMDVVRSCCGGAMFLPIVQFHNGTEVSQVATGSWPEFRQSLAAFMRSIIPLPSPFQSAVDVELNPESYAHRLRKLLAAATPASAHTSFETGAGTCDGTGCRIDLKLLCS